MATSAKGIRDQLAHLRPHRSAARAWLTPDRLVVLFLRVVSVLYLGASIEVWSSLIGWGAGPHLADISLERQLLTVVLAILCPFVVVGLWMAASWGIVMWLLTTAVWLVADLGFVPGEPADRFAAGASMASIALYLVLAVWRARHNARTGLPRHSAS